jgi:predicted dehydrogenase
MKVALVGCGTIAPAHLRALKMIVPGVEIYLCDVDHSHAEELGAKWGISRLYTDLEEMLSSEHLDSVHILTPPRSHAEIALKVIQAGSHALVEKPITETSEEFTKLSKLAKEKQRILAANYSSLGMPIVMDVRQQIAFGSLGRLIAVHCTYAASWPGNTIPYGDADHWAYHLLGGVLQNWADHPLSLIVSVMEPIQEHRVVVHHRNILPLGSPDLLHVVLKSHDQIGSFTLSLGHGNTDIRAHFILEGGSIILDLRRMLMNVTKGRGPANIVKRALSGILEGYSNISGTLSNVVSMATKRLQREPGIFAIIRNFYRTIEAKEELLVNHEVVSAITRILEEIWKEIPARKS